MSTDLQKEKACAKIDPVKFLANRGLDFTALPESLRRGYATWWCFGIPAGSFLQAVIEGDLFEAHGKADHLNQARMPELLNWFWNHADARCIRKNAKSWGTRGGHFGRQAEAEGEGTTNAL